ncbi:MAG TPA: arginase [Gammaproteobacteria bacterium]|nr:arginase [Gammaproteobacteria bacterium]
MLHLLGYAIGNGGKDTRCCTGPIVVQHALQQNPVINRSVEWLEHLYPRTTHTQLAALQDLKDCNERLSSMVEYLLKNKHSFCVIGGDHSSAIGTWSGASKHQEGPIGLLYIDAHLDAHTQASSMTHNIHGMPITALLGQGNPELTKISHPQPKIDPKHLVFFGTRDYEQQEYDLIHDLGITVYDMTTIHSMGIKKALTEAHNQVASCPFGYGCSIDVDAFDPTQFPAVGNPADNGLDPSEFIDAFKLLKRDHCLGYEISEFNPSLDFEDKSLSWLIRLLETFL